MPLKQDTKKTTFFISSNKFFFKEGLQDNHWVENLVMKSVYALAFKKQKKTDEGNHD